MKAVPDGHTSQPHVHVDHVFLAVTPATIPAAIPEHQVRWFTADEITTAAGISQDSRMQAAELFTHITGNSLAPDRPAHSKDSVGDPVLIVLRGNSATGKSSVAAQIRQRFGRGISIVSQDNLRRAVLRERDIPGGANIGLIEQVTRYALQAGFHTVLEGILRNDHYGPMLQRLICERPGSSYLYYLDAPFSETLRRHTTKPQAAEYGEAEMRQWYRDKDLLPGGAEQVIGSDSSLADTVERIMTAAGLAQLPGARHVG